MEELKTVKIELYALKSDSVLILVEYLNEKREHCMRTDKIQCPKKNALTMTQAIIKAFEEDYSNIDIKLKYTL